MLRAIVAVVVLAGTAHAQPFVGSAAPALDLPALDGKLVSTTQLAGRVAVVDFFATWCGPCLQAMAALDAVARADPRIQLIVVDVAEPASTVRAFFSGRSLPPGARVLLDSDGAVARRWGQRRFPTTFLVDGAGQIRHINRGYGPGYPERVAAWLRQMVR